MELNKINRKSGGFPKRPIPENFEKYLRYVNEIASFFNDCGITNPTYFHLPQSPSLYNPQVIIDTFSGPMKHLETVLRIISPDFAMDVLRNARCFADRDDEFLTNLLHDSSVPIFRPELGDEGANDFLDCLRRYVGFETLYYLLDSLVFSWRHQKEDTKLFFEDDSNSNKTFHLIENRLRNWNEAFHLSVRATKSKKPGELEFFVEVKNNEWIEVLQGLEIERVRRCKYCLKFFWAETVKKISCCSDGKSKEGDPISIKRVGMEKILSDQARNREIRKQVEAQPESTYEPPPEEVFPEESNDQYLLNSLVLVNGEPHTVVEVRENMQVLLPVPHIGWIRTFAKRVKRKIW